MTPRHESPFLFIYKLIGLQTEATVPRFVEKKLFGLPPLELGGDCIRELLNSGGLAIC
jgi:hypothetical protein